MNTIKLQEDIVMTSTSVNSLQNRTQFVIHYPPPSTTRTAYSRTAPLHSLASSVHPLASSAHPLAYSAHSLASSMHSLTSSMLLSCNAFSNLIPDCASAITGSLYRFISSLRGKICFHESPDRGDNDFMCLNNSSLLYNSVKPSEKCTEGRHL